MLTTLPNVEAKELKELRRRCALMLQQEDPDRFPGSQPVSFEKKHLAPQSESSRGGISLLQKVTLRLELKTAAPAHCCPAFLESHTVS